MKAKIAPRAEIDRKILKDVVPVSTPYVVNIFTGDVCNFKCVYCVNSVDKREIKDKNTLSTELLSWERFKKIADQMCEFPDPIKKVCLTSIGEPMINKNLPKMIAYLKNTLRVKSIDIITNASLLTPELSNQLIEAGLDRMVISIQGTTAKKYKDICGTEIDFENFINNIKYFYDNKRQCKIFIKTVDIALDSHEDRTKFFEIFGNICDQIYIDNAYELFDDVDYSDMKLEREKTLYGKNIIEIDICPQAFYTIDIRSNGNAVPCCQAPYPVSFGNIEEENIVQIWNSEKRRQFLIMMLRKERKKHPICKKCIVPTMATADEKDILDGYENEILARMKRSQI